MNEEKRNMKISGSGSMPGGEFDKVSVSGAGKVDGSLRCEELNCSGSAKIAGDARVAERLHCSGSVKVEGDVGCGGEMHVSGAFQCGGNAAAQEFHGSGATRIGGELSGTELHVSGVLHAARVHCTELRASGSLDVDGGVEAERAALSGVVKIGGLLNAEKLEFYPAGHCEVGDIGGACRKLACLGGFWGFTAEQDAGDKSERACGRVQICPKNLFLDNAPQWAYV